MDPRPETRLEPRLRSERIRLLGFRGRGGSPAAAAVSEQRPRFEWVVDAGVTSRRLLTSKARYFLVPEGAREGQEIRRTAEADLAALAEASGLFDASALIEIAPLAWFAPAQLQEIGFARRGELVYRVYVLPSITAEFVVTDRQESPLPLFRGSARDWTLPASFQQ